MFVSGANFAPHFSLVAQTSPTNRTSKSKEDPLMPEQLTHPHPFEALDTHVAVQCNGKVVQGTIDRIHSQELVDVKTSGGPCCAPFVINPTETNGCTLATMTF
jgi:hypothetical protein